MTTTAPVIHDHDTVIIASDVDLKVYAQWAEAKDEADAAAKRVKDAREALEKSLEDSKADVLIDPTTGRALARYTITEPKPVVDTRAAAAALIDAGIPVPMTTPKGVTRFTVNR